MHSQKKVSKGVLARSGKYPLIAAIAFFVIAALYLYRDQTRAGSALTEAKVLEVNDGDSVTLRMHGRIYRARLIGIDAPELGQEPWGQRAKERLTAIMRESGWTVAVETDLEKRDKYDRLLVYLWSRDKKFINELMLKDGYAVLFTIQPNSKHVALFVEAQRFARENKKGIWGPDGLKEKPIEYKKTHPRK